MEFKYVNLKTSFIAKTDYSIYDDMYGKSAYVLLLRWACEGHFVEEDQFVEDLTATVEFHVGSSQQNLHSSSRTSVFLSKDTKFLFFNGKFEPNSF